ncbi:MAG: hypothetical protein R3293_04685 [Candidatus Promineifilaceae bacterium]|nr:hypothetical protein [Candidatus Promineifilaceae bacterium]
MQKLVILIISLVILVACSSGEGTEPAETVEKYLQAKADANADVIGQLLCSEMEAVLERESRTFESVSGVHIEDMACEQVKDSQVVTCQGKIVATYGAEDTEFPLASYRVVEEDGEWKWCGEAAQ